MVIKKYDEIKSNILILFFPFIHKRYFKGSKRDGIAVLRERDCDRKHKDISKSLKHINS